jgi:hypothetical protein
MGAVLLVAAAGFALAHGDPSEPGSGAQPVDWTLAIDDSPPLDLEPLEPNIAGSASLYVTRAALSPGARARLAAGLGLPHITTRDAEVIGPAFFHRGRLASIPGDSRLRVERGDCAVSVLGVGATIEETLAAAQEEPFLRCVLIGAAPEAMPPGSWIRCGDAAVRPVVWQRGMDVHLDRDQGGVRELIFLDGGVRSAPQPPHLRDYRAQAMLGPFPRDLAGLAAAPDGTLFWSWEDRLVRTNARGDVLASLLVEGHLADVTWHDGRVVGILRSVAGEAAPQACTFDAVTLEVLARAPISEVGPSARAICWTGARYLVAGDEAHEYDKELRWVRRVCGADEFGAPVLSATHAAGRLILECGGDRPAILVTSLDLRSVVRLPEHFARRGLADAGGGWLLRGFTRQQDGAFAGSTVQMPVTLVGY